MQTLTPVQHIKKSIIKTLNQEFKDTDFNKGYKSALVDLLEAIENNILDIEKKALRHAWRNAANIEDPFYFFETFEQFYEHFYN